MEIEERLRALYGAFNARDAGAALAGMTEDVDWPNAWEGGRLQGREAVREYWERQWGELDSSVEPVTFDLRPDGRIAVEVDQVVRGADGEVLTRRRVWHVYELRGDLVARMTVED
jgi:ketosteroid isomerase-like protein